MVLLPVLLALGTLVFKKNLRVTDNDINKLTWKYLILFSFLETEVSLDSPN